ncbi:MAG: hypothetical protein MJ168_11190 [Clostridia bacterium]|nr:hypothetical protein [Clostridia bacterium]
MKKNRNSVTGYMRSESYVGGVMYQQSAEVAVLYRQSFELARLKLDRHLEENRSSGKNLAIVTDIDATLIDDSGYFSGVLTNAHGRAEEGKAPWNNKDWCGYYKSAASESSKALPGAVEFINYARQQGVQVFFITNRPYYELDLTVHQLYKEGFIDEKILNEYSGLAADGVNLQRQFTGDELQRFKQKVNSETEFELGDNYFSLKNDYTVQVQGANPSIDKAERRNNVAKKLGENGVVVMYLGDSLNDMISVDEYKYTDYSQDESNQFDRKLGNAARNEAVMNEPWRDKWGTEFIIMPNSVYGDWQKATWFQKDVDEKSEMNAIRNQLLKHSYLNSKVWYNGASPTGNDVK